MDHAMETSGCLDRSWLSELGMRGFSFLGFRISGLVFRSRV